MKRILIVGGLQEEREAYQLALETSLNEPFEIHHTDSGHEALLACKSTPPDCIVIDYYLFDLDIKEFFSLLAKQESSYSIPAIVMCEDDIHANVLSEIKHTISLLRKSDLQENTLSHALLATFNQSKYQTKLLEQKNQFLISLRQSLARAKRFDRNAAVLLFEIDNYTQVESNIGPKNMRLLAGKILQRLQSTLRYHDSTAQIKPAHFAIALDEISQNMDASLVARRILDVLSIPFDLVDLKVQIHFNMGISCYPYDCSSAEMALSNAEIAMSRAQKQAGKHCEYYDDQLQQLDIKQQKIIADLPSAYASGELYLNYQPISHATSKEVVGYQAMIRWQHPNVDIIRPRDFIPLAERCGLIIEIGEWIIATACQEFKPWLSKRDAIQLNLKVSSRQLAHSEFVDSVTAILQQNQIQPSNLVLEFSESALVTHSTRIWESMSRLKELGVLLCLSEFARETSFLHYLSDNTIDIIKIDTNFIKNCNNNPQSAHMIQAAVQLAKCFGLKVLAPGITAQEQLDVVTQLGCDLVQGYLLAEVVPYQEVANYLTNLKTQKPKRA